MVNAFSFSYTPKPSTALASITPLKLLGEGREALRFAASTPMSFIKQNPEIVTEGFWKGRQALTEGIVKGATSALSGVAGALTQKAADAKATKDAELEHTRAKEIANIKSSPTAAETAYQQQRSDLLTQQIAAAKAKNENVTATESTGSLVPREIDFFSDLESIPDFGKQPVETPAPVDKPAADANSAPSSPPAAPVVPNAPVAPAGVSAFAPGDAGRGLFQFDQGTGTDIYGNVPPRQSSMAFNLAPLSQTETIVAAAPNDQPAVTQVAPKSVFDQSTNGIVPLRDTLKKTEAISGTIPLPAPSPAPVLSEVTLPESEGSMTLGKDTFELMPVSGAEGIAPAKTSAKPLEGTTPPPVESALPQQVPTKPVEEKAVPFTQDQVRYYLEDKYTSRPYQSPADANMAKKLLEQKLGVKVEIDTEKGEKGTRLYHVRIVGDAPAAKTAPEGFFIKKITDADGKETYVYEPKIPAKQQIATFDSNIEKAKALQETLTRIKEIAPGYLFAGAGGISGLTKYNPFANDARTTRSLLNTVKGIVGFDELVALKAQGGTLGALSDKELDMLTSLKGSIDPDMDEATFLKNINKMSESTTKLIAGLEADKKQVTKVENKNNFQPIQSEKSANKKGDSFILEGNRYVHDGTKFVLTK